MSELHVDLAARLVNLTSAVRAAFAAATAGLPDAERTKLARAAVEQLAALETAPAQAPRAAFRPVIVRSDSSISAIYEPPPVRPSRRARALPVELPADFESKMTAILDDRPRIGETIELAFRRKEVALGELFGTLDVVASRALHRRLAQPTSFDALAQKFGRFVTERRARLLAFLADAPRRAAMKRGA